MNTKVKRTLALAMTVMMMLSMATACGKRGGDSSEAETSASSDVSSEGTSSVVKKDPTVDNPIDDPSLVSDYQVKVSAENKTTMEEKKKEVKDVVAYLEIPGTTIKDFVVQATQEQDAEAIKANGERYYERKDIYGNYSFDGSYFMDSDCQIGKGTKKQMSQNTIIYGHNLGNPQGQKDDPNGTLFAQLLKFEDVEFAKEHPYIYLTTEGENLVYQIFAVVFTEANMTPVNYIYAKYDDEKQYMQLIDDIRDRSYLDYPDITITPNDKILTLSTCTYKEGTYQENNQQRFVVFGRLVKGKNFAETANVKENPDPKKPIFS